MRNQFSHSVVSDSVTPWIAAHQFMIYIYSEEFILEELTLCINNCGNQLKSWPKSVVFAYELGREALGEDDDEQGGIGTPGDETGTHKNGLEPLLVCPSPIARGRWSVMAAGVLWHRSKHSSVLWLEKLRLGTGGVMDRDLTHPTPSSWWTGRLYYVWVAVVPARETAQIFHILKKNKGAASTSQVLCKHYLWSVCKSLSCVQLFETPWTPAHLAPLSVGILQARILEWVAMPSSRGSSQSRNRILISSVSYIGKQVLCHYSHLGSPLVAHTNLKLHSEENSWKGGSILTKLTQYESITGTGGGLVAQSCLSL